MKLARLLAAGASGVSFPDSRLKQSINTAGGRNRPSRSGNARQRGAIVREADDMVAPGFLANAIVREWLDGAVPAWTWLDSESFNALRQERIAPGTAIQVQDDVTEGDLANCIFVRNTTVLLRYAVENGGLGLTATGNLTRAVVAQMIPKMEWPAFSKADMYRYNRVINEPDFAPLHIVRVNAVAARLLRVHRRKLIATKSGRGMVLSQRGGPLLAQLLSAVFWGRDRSDNGRNLLGGWPLHDISVVLWSLCVSATDWQSPEVLARLCTIPINGVLETSWDVGSTAIEAHVLRPLLWFGLVEHRQEDIPGSRFGSRHFYRKTQLFDKVIRFNVTLESANSLLQ